MMQDLITEFGYVGLFIIAFLSDSFVPLVGGVFLVAMPPLGYDIWLSFLFATAGNTLGALFNYYIGQKGGEFVFSRYFKISPDQLHRSRRFFERWGTPALILSWVPIIGDPLTIVAGLLGIDLLIFSIWVVLGKVLRNLFLLGLANALLNLWTS